MKKMITIAVMLVMSIMLLAPQAAYAVTAPPPPANLWYGTMQVEYRFAEDETFYIPPQVTRFGYTYNLVSQTAPVLESEMPLVRTYSYRVEGFLDEDQLEEIKGDPNIVATPVMVPAEKEVDKIDVTYPRTNDVDRIDDQKEFALVVDFEADGTPIMDDVLLDRTGLTFEVGPLDEDGLPIGYIATAIYRGVELELIPGYFQIDVTSFTSSEESDVPIYVIIADYRTNEMPPPVQTTLGGAGAAGAGAGPGAGPEETTPEGLTAIEDQQVALQEGAGPADLPGIVQDIADGLVPQGNTEVTGLWSLLSMIFCAAGAIVVGLSILASAVAKRRRDSALNAPSLLNNRSFLLRILTIVVAAFTIFTWLLLDDFTRGMVWVNENTLVVWILFVATVVVSVIANVYERKASKSIDEDMQDSFTANAG